jgi:YD repeat-containing protein
MPATSGAPSGGPVTPQELPGSVNPSEPYAGFSQGCGLQGGDPALCSPVNPVTGALSLTLSDVMVPERGPALDLSRTYNSFFASTPGPFGYGWSFSWGMRLSFHRTAVVFHQENGSEVTFTRTKKKGVFKSAPRVIAALSPAPKKGLASRSSANGVSFIVTRGARQPSCATFDRSCVMFGFSGTGRLLEAADLDGNTTTFHYNAAGLLTSVTDAAGRVVTISYHGRQIDRVVDPAGRVTSYTYDSSGDLTSVTDPTDEKNQIYYYFNHGSGQHRLIGSADAMGHQTAYAYDPHGRVVAVTDPLGNVTHLGYAKSSTTITSPQGIKKVLTINHAEDVTLKRGVVNGSSLATWLQSLDPKTLGPIAIRDPNGNVWKYTYDLLGDVTSSTDPLGHTSRFAYGAADRTATVTDPMGSSTRYAYDTRGNLLSIHGPSPVETTFHYGAAHPGDVTSITDPTGQVWTYAQDADGNLVSAINPDGGETTYTYDARGDLLSVTAPNGNLPGQFTAHYAYDADGRLVHVTDPLGHQSSLKWNADGQLVSATDPMENATTYAYDADGRLIGLTRPDGTTTTDRYTADGNLSGQTDPSGSTMSYSYDALGRLMAATDPLGHVEQYSYDPNGNLTQIGRPDGSLIHHSYDAAGQLISTSYSGPGTHGVTYTYDADGRRVSMTDGTGTSTYGYDALSRLIKTVDGGGNVDSYSYDARGDVTGMIYPDGGAVNYVYDGAGRMTSLTDMRGNVTTYQYDADGNLVGTSMPNMQNDAYTYDADGRLTGIQDTTGSLINLSLTYARNADGLVTLVQQSGGSGPQQTSLTYDTDGRLTSENSGDYGYDPSGALTGLPSGATLTYDAAHELQQMSLPGAAQTTYSYDANGNRTGSSAGGAGTTFSYDSAGNLTGYANSAMSVTYANNGDGLRTSTTVGTSKQNLVWNPTSNPPSLIQVGPSDIVYGPGGLPQEQMTPAGNAQYFVPDQQGNTRELTDLSGNVIATFNYDAFGNVTSQTGAATTSFGFDGQYTDPASGLVNMAGGQYDPGTRQYLAHVGQEVVVDFLEGDPDRPIVIGSAGHSGYSGRQWTVGPTSDIFGGGILPGGVLNLGSGGGILTPSGGTLTLAGGLTLTGGTLALGGGLTLTGGTLALGGGVFNGTGTLVNGSPGSALTKAGIGIFVNGTSGGGLTKTGSGTLPLTGSTSGGSVTSGEGLTFTGGVVTTSGGNAWGGALTLGSGGGCAGGYPCASIALTSATASPATLERTDPYFSAVSPARIDPYVIANDDPVNP